MTPLNIPFFKQRTSNFWSFSKKPYVMIESNIFLKTYFDYLFLFGRVSSEPALWHPAVTVSLCNDVRKKGFIFHPIFHVLRQYYPSLILFLLCLSNQLIITVCYGKNLLLALSNPSYPHHSRHVVSVVSPFLV